MIKLPYKSSSKPVQPSAFDIALGFSQINELSKQLEALRNEHKSVLESHNMEFEKTINAKIEELDTVLQEVLKIQKGDKGDMPTPGIDFPIPEDGKSVDENLIVQKVLSQIRQPKDGDTPIVDENGIIKKVLSKIPKSEPVKVPVVDHQAIVDKIFEILNSGKNKLSIKHIGDFTDGLEQTIRPIRSLMAGFRGGGDVVIPGSNITITTDANGKKIIASTAGGGTFVDNEVVLGNGTSWTLASVPILGTEHIFASRNRLFVNTDYTISGKNITLINGNTFVTGDLLADYQK